MNSFDDFKLRMHEIDDLLSLVPERPSSENVSTINTLCRASIILLSSHLEGFLQDLMEEFVEEINQLSLGFNHLPLELYIQHNFPKGQISSNNFDTLVKIFEEIKILQNGNIPITLEKKSFSNTESNPTSDLINRLFKIIGINDILDILNDEVKNLRSADGTQCFFTDIEKNELITQLGCPNIINRIDQYITGKRKASSKKKRTVGFYNTINQLLKYRNTVAHGNRQIVISIQDLIVLKEDITCLAENLAIKASDRISHIKSLAQSQREVAMAR